MRLWIRADASASLGLGHVMRSIAIAERAVRRGITPAFVIGGSDLGIRILQDRGWSASPVESFPAGWTNETTPGDAVVFDGYRFPAMEMRACRDQGCRVGAIDDLGAGDFPVDVLLNQNPLMEYNYRTLSSTIRLFGPGYALVRVEFELYRRDRADDAPRVLLVSMGGSDVAHLTGRTVDLLRRRTAFERVRVVVGPAARPPVDAALPADVDVVRNPDNVAAVFDSADAAVAAAGSTTWEFLALGLPAALVRVADNQRAIGPGLVDSGAALFLGGPEEYAHALLPAVEQLADPEVRRGLCRNALTTVDGSGADRFLTALLEGREPPEH